MDSPEITVGELQTHLSFLASDTLEGREAGTAGGQATAAYLAAELKRLEFSPLGLESDFRLPFGARYQNVLGLLPGSDPALKSEWIIIGAHFDHVGFGRPDNSRGPLGLVHNGADDNGSGVACLLEIAENLRLAPPLSRSVMFAFWDAEEKGLLGSENWLSRQENRSHLRFYVNLDMVGRIRGDAVEVFGVRTLPNLRTMLAKSNVGNLRMTFDYAQRDDSDHFTFYNRSIPYCMVYSGMHDDYHRPSDDVEKLNFEGISQIAQLLVAQVTALANHAGPLEFRDESRYERTRSVPGTHLPSRFGVTWSPTRKLGETIVLSRVDPGSPADRVGLKPGDELIRINGSDLREVEDFVAWVRRSPTQWEIEYMKAADRSKATLSLALNGDPLPVGVTATGDSAEPGIAIIRVVQPNSLAARWGFQTGDRLHAVREGATVEDRIWHVERDGRLQWLPAASEPAPVPPPQNP